MTHSMRLDSRLSIRRYPREIIREILQIHGNKHHTHLAVLTGITPLLSMEIYYWQFRLFII